MTKDMDARMAEFVLRIAYVDVYASAGVSYHKVGKDVDCQV